MGISLSVSVLKHSSSSALSPLDSAYEAGGCVCKTTLTDKWAITNLVDSYDLETSPLPIEILPSSPGK